MSLLSNPRHSRVDCISPRSALAFVTLVVVSATGLLAADEPPNSAREENRRRVADMSVAERDRLQENFQSFQALPPHEQARLRDLYAALENDAALKKAFDAYQAWANSLSPAQRHELRQTKDPDARLRMIEQFRRHGGPPGSLPPGDGLERFFRRPEVWPVASKVVGSLRGFGNVPSTPDEAAAMIEVLEKQLAQARRDELRQLDPFTRRVRVFRDTLQRTHGMAPMLRLTGDAENDLHKQLLAVLDDGSPARDFIENKKEGFEQRMALFAVLSRGLVTDLLATINARFPSDQALREFEQKKLSSAERESLLRTPEPDRRIQLQLRYLEDLVPGIRDWRDMSIEVQTLQSEFWRARMPSGEGRGTRSGGPPFGPFDGSRRPDRRPEDERDRNGERRPNDERGKDRRPDEREAKPEKPMP